MLKRQKPICKVPEIKFGNQPIDGGHLIFTQEEKEIFIKTEPGSELLFRKYIGSEELIHSKARYCLWLINTSPNELGRMPQILKCLEKVRQFRLSSKRSDTRNLSQTPGIFAFISHEEKEYIILPSVSSEKRKYIPLDYMEKDVIASNLCLTIYDGTSYHFGILTSEMHMTWVRYVCGRLESRYRYSNTIVYNNFPWPEDPTVKQRKMVEALAQKVLDTRAQFPGSSLADLYDPLTMPPALVKAHQELDKAVDLCYRPQPFSSETKRIEFLFDLYEKYLARSSQSCSYFPNLHR